MQPNQVHQDEQAAARVEETLGERTETNPHKGRERVQESIVRGEWMRDWRDQHVHEVAREHMRACIRENGTCAHRPDEHVREP